MTGPLVRRDRCGRVSARARASSRPRRRRPSPPRARADPSAGIVPPAPAAGAWPGYLSYAAADACMVDGVAGPWPHDRRRVYLAPRRLRTPSGGRGERRLLLALVAPFLVLYARLSHMTWALPTLW